MHFGRHSTACDISFITTVVTQKDNMRHERGCQHLNGTADGQVCDVVNALLLRLVSEIRNEPFDEEVSEWDAIQVGPRTAPKR